MSTQANFVIFLYWCHTSTKPKWEWIFQMWSTMIVVQLSNNPYQAGWVLADQMSLSESKALEKFAQYSVKIVVQMSAYDHNRKPILRCMDRNWLDPDWAIKVLNSAHVVALNTHRAQSRSGSIAMESARLTLVLIDEKGLRM